jgi:hypothetical protein
MGVSSLASRFAQLRRAAVAAFPRVEAEKRGHFQTKESSSPDAAQSMAMTNNAYHVRSPHSESVQRKNGTSDHTFTHKPSV